ncbi:MAG: GNAT family N-acetyltransferase, partial [Candidatus Omnitrophica bacterium]|nr:GNAT family N-acetyltransferase [Candidatus Omnitrophota bacterium]
MNTWRSSRKEDLIFPEQSIEGMADWKKRHAFFIKVIACIIIFAFILFDITWAQGGTPLGSGANAVKVNGKVHPDGIVIPNDAGWAHDSHFTGSDEFIFNIQDPHASLAAQHSIVKILESLTANYDLNLIALEGAEGPIDVSFLRTFPDPEIKRHAAEYLMREGRMSAGEFYAIVSQKPIKLYGIEDSKLYLKNVKVLTKFMESRQGCLPHIEGALTVLDTLTPKVYSKDLEKLVETATLHGQNKITFVAYWAVISSLIRKYNINIDIYKNLPTLLRAIEIEKTINNKELNKERKELLDELAGILAKPELEILVKKSLAYKTGKISQNDFHKYAMELAGKKNFDLSKYPNLTAFTDYILSYENIDFMLLFREVEQIETHLRESLFRNDEEIALYNYTKAVRTTKKLFDIAIGNDDYDFILNKKEYFQNDKLGEFISNAYQKYGLKHAGNYNIDLVFNKLDDGAELYNVAQMRNDAMVSNTVKAMQLNNEGAAALITGGFHSKGLAELIREKKLSYLIIMPKYEGGHERPYIAVLTQKTKPYDELLETGEYMLAVKAFCWDSDTDKMADVIMRNAVDMYKRGLTDEKKIEFVRNHCKGFLPLFDQYEEARAQWIAEMEERARLDPGRMPKTPVTKKDFYAIYGIEADAEGNPELDETGEIKVQLEKQPSVEQVTVNGTEVFVVTYQLGSRRYTGCFTVDKKGNINLLRGNKARDAKELLGKRKGKRRIGLEGIEAPEVAPIVLEEIDLSTPREIKKIKLLLGEGLAQVDEGAREEFVAQTADRFNKPIESKSDIRRAHRAFTQIANRKGYNLGKIDEEGFTQSILPMIQAKIARAPVSEAPLLAKPIAKAIEVAKTTVPEEARVSLPKTTIEVTEKPVTVPVEQTGALPEKIFEEVPVKGVIGVLAWDKVKGFFGKFISKERYENLIVPALELAYPLLGLTALSLIQRTGFVGVASLALFSWPVVIALIVVGVLFVGSHPKAVGAIIEKLTARAPSYDIQPLTKEFTQDPQYKDALHALVNTLPHPPENPEMMFADAWEAGENDQAQDREFYAKWEHSLVVLDKSGQPIGMLVAYERPAGEREGLDNISLFIHALVVNPDHQNEGIGTKLMKTAAGHLQNTGFTELEQDYDGHPLMSLQAGTQNFEVQRLYERLGFKRVGMAGDYAHVYQTDVSEIAPYSLKDAIIPASIAGFRLALALTLGLLLGPGLTALITFIVLDYTFHAGLNTLADFLKRGYGVELAKGVSSVFEFLIHIIIRRWTSSTQVHPEYLDPVFAANNIVPSFSPWLFMPEGERTAGVPLPLRLQIQSITPDLYDKLADLGLQDRYTTVHLMSVQPDADSPKVQLNLCAPDNEVRALLENPIIYDTLRRLDIKGPITLHLGFGIESFTEAAGVPSATSPALSEEEIMRRVVQNVELLRQKLEENEFGDKEILLENIAYFEGTETVVRPDFILKVAEAAGCGLLVDLGHVIINAQHFVQEPIEYLRELVNPETIGLVVEVHISIPAYREGTQDFVHGGWYGTPYGSFSQDTPGSQEVKRLLQYIVGLRKATNTGRELVVNFETEDDLSRQDVAKLAEVLEEEGIGPEGPTLTTPANRQKAIAYYKERLGEDAWNNLSKTQQEQLIGQYAAKKERKDIFRDPIKFLKEHEKVPLIQGIIRALGLIAILLATWSPILIRPLINKRTFLRYSLTLNTNFHRLYNDLAVRFGWGMLAKSKDIGEPGQPKLDITDIGTPGTHALDYQNQYTRPRTTYAKNVGRFTALTYTGNEFTIAEKGQNATNADKAFMNRIIEITDNARLQKFMQQHTEELGDVRIYLLEPAEERTALHPHFLTVVGKQFDIAGAGTSGGKEQAVYMTRAAFNDLDVELLADILINQMTLAIARYSTWRSGVEFLPGNPNSTKVRAILDRVRADDMIKAELKKVHQYDMALDKKYAIGPKKYNEVVELLQLIKTKMGEFAPAITNYQRGLRFKEALEQHDYDSAILWWGLITFELRELTLEDMEESKKILSLSAAQRLLEVAADINERFGRYIMDHGIYNREGEEYGIAVGRVRVVDDLSKIDEEFANAEGDEIWVIPYPPVRIPEIPGIGCIISIAGNRHAIDTAKEQCIPLAVIPNATKLLRDFNDHMGMLRVDRDRAVRFRNAFEGEEGAPRTRSRIDVKVPKARVDGRPIYRLNDIDENFVTFVGSKAANLGKMISGDVKVPEGIALAYSFWDAFKRHNNLDERIAEIRDKIKTEGKEIITEEEELQAVLQEIKDLIISGEFPEELKDQLFPYINEMRQTYGANTLFYIRSSFNFEDLTEKTTAGHYDSYPDENFLDTSSDENILEAVKMVFASAWNEKAFRAKVGSGIKDSDVLPGVIIQVPVKARFAGTMYTASPYSYSRNEMAIMASHGQGAAVVGEEGRPAEVIVDKITRRITIRQRESWKDIEHHVADGKIEVVYVTTEERQGEIFTEELVNRLKEEGERVEALYDFRPQDIEWCYDTEGNIWFVQTRPAKTEKLPAEKMIDDAILDLLAEIDESELFAIKQAQHNLDFETLLTHLYPDETSHELGKDPARYAERLVSARCLASMADNGEAIDQVTLDQVQRIIDLFEEDGGISVNFHDPACSPQLQYFLRGVGLASHNSDIQAKVKKFFIKLGTINTIQLYHLINFETAKALVAYGNYDAALKKLRKASLVVEFPGIADRSIKILGTIPTESSIKMLEKFSESEKASGWIREFARRAIDWLENQMAQETGPSTLTTPATRQSAISYYIERFTQAWWDAKSNKEKELLIGQYAARKERKDIFRDPVRFLKEHEKVPLIQGIIRAVGLIA